MGARRCMKGLDMRLWNVHDVADALSVSPRKVWAMLSAEQIPRPIRVGGRSVRWRQADIEEWVRNGCPATADSGKYTVPVR